MKGDCLFCKIGRGEIPSHRVHEDALTLAFMEDGPGHVIVAVQPHLETIVDLSSDQAAAVFGAVHQVARPVMAALEPDGLTIVQANGAAGGQTVPHFHLHVLPRYANDGVSLTWPRKNLPADELARLASQIRGRVMASIACDEFVTPTGDHARMDTPAAATGFVVWITRDAEGRVAGTVERVRTGEKHRFRDLDALGVLIDRMTASPERAE
jgi:histidine triad (HIT) family protein